MFDTLQDRLAATFKNLRGKGKLTEADIDATAREIRIALLEADVNLGVVKEFIKNIKERCLGAEVSEALNPSQQIIKIVNEELVEILGGDTRTIRFAKKPPTVIMLAGLQGAGKTTLAGKLAHWLKSEGHSPLLVAADLQRPNAVNQLQVVAGRAGVHCFAPEPGNGVGDPVQVARASIEEANRRLYDVVIVDTAGRLGVDEVLMQQAADIKAAVTPDEVLFVVDAMIGQDAVNTAQAFADGVGYDGVVLTKLDGDARGGAALSIARVIGKPIMFASSGEGMKDFDVFHPERMASRILGMGDMLTLIEQAEKTFDEEKSRKAHEKIVTKGGSGFGLGDFLEQMKMIRKMGPLSKLFGMLPGMDGAMKDQLNNIDEKEVDRIEAIILSMTPAERDDPKILNGSRRARIAKGSGTEVSEVNNLVNRFFEARKVMSSFANGQMPAGVPGMPGMPQGALPGGGGGGSQKQQKKRKKNAKGVSGNPNKRRAQAARKNQPAAQEPASDPAAAFGHGFDPKQFGGGFGGQKPGDFDIPPELEKMFKQGK